MDDVLGYDGKRVVVTGAASGMAEQAATILADLGAEVIALDIKPVTADVKTAIQIDLGNRASIDATLAAIDGTVDAVFSCAGLPGPPFTDIQVVTVNFIGARHLDRGPRRPDAAGLGAWHASHRRQGIGWQQQIETFAPLARDPLPSRMRSRGSKHIPRSCRGGGYVCSKVVLNQRVAVARSFDYMTERGIRLELHQPPALPTPR